MITDRKGNRLPDFLLVGAAKSGTTSLFKALGDHPLLALPSVKEPEHLALVESTSQLLSRETLISSYEAYLQLFRSLPPDSLTGEASTVYLPLIDHVIERLDGLTKQAREIKVIVVLREPVARLHSHYLMKALRGREQLSLEEALQEEVVATRYEQGFDITYDYIRYSKYGDHIQSMLAYFYNIFIINYDDLKQDFTGVINRVFSFLGVPTGVDVRQVWENVGGDRRSDLVGRTLHLLLYREHLVGRLGRQLLPTAARARLHSLLAPLVFSPVAPSAQLRQSLGPVFEADIQHVERLTGLDLSRWRTA